MPTEMLTKPEPTVTQPLPAAEPAEDKLHERARKRVERRHSVTANIAAFVAGMIVLMPVPHLVPTRSVVAGFGRISLDNGRMLTMEWVAERLTLVFKACPLVPASAVALLLVGSAL